MWYSIKAFCLLLAFALLYWPLGPPPLPWFITPLCGLLCCMVPSPYFRSIGVCLCMCSSFTRREYFINNLWASFNICKSLCLCMYVGKNFSIQFRKITGYYYLQKYVSKDISIALNTSYSNTHDYYFHLHFYITMFSYFELLWYRSIAPQTRLFCQKCLAFCIQPSQTH